jgi:hypothetical protein
MKFDNVLPNKREYVTKFFLLLRLIKNLSQNKKTGTVLLQKVSKET